MADDPECTAIILRSVPCQASASSDLLSSSSWMDWASSLSRSCNRTPDPRREDVLIDASGKRQRKSVLLSSEVVPALFPLYSLPSIPGIQ